MPELVQGGRLKICCVRTRGFESHSKHNIQTVYIMLDVIYEQNDIKYKYKSIIVKTFKIKLLTASQFAL